MNSYLIQAGVSIITAIIVTFITLTISNRKYYEQQWWMKKSEKYEIILNTLGALKRIYDELNFQTSDGSNMNHKRFPEFFDLKTKLRIETVTGRFYMDTETVQLLEKLDSRFFYEAEEYGSCPDNDILYPTVNLLEEVIDTIIKNAKKELKGN